MKCLLHPRIVVKWLRVLLPLLALVPLASGHQPGTSSLVLVQNEGGTLEAEYHVANADIESIRLMMEDKALAKAAQNKGIPIDGATGELAWMTLMVDGKSLSLEVGAPQEVSTDGRLHTMIPFQTSPYIGEDLRVEFVDFFSFDPQHHVVTSLEIEGETKVGLLSIDEPVWEVSLSAPGAMGQFIKFTWEGVWHIWIGIDHILFLIALLLPSVVRFENGRWQPVAHFRDAFYAVLKVVTAFTLAHSVTLSLAALQIISLPSKFVESVIALSVVLAALNNIRPIVRERIWTVAFGFGLIHGFGFANVLADLQLPTGTLAVALFSFNVGVEMGQMAIVAVFFPFIFLIRAHPLYLPVKLKLGSATIALIASAWMVDRIFEMDFMPF